MSEQGERMRRSTAEVFDDHLRRADDGDIDGDIAANYAADCALLTTYGRFDGHEGVKQAAELLAQQIPRASFTYTQRVVHEDIAFLEWTATGASALVRDGADSFLIRDGLIKIMTIHYTIESVRV